MQILKSWVKIRLCRLWWRKKIFAFSLNSRCFFVKCCLICKCIGISPYSYLRSFVVCVSCS